MSYLLDSLSNSPRQPMASIPPRSGSADVEHEALLSYDTEPLQRELVDRLALPDQDLLDEADGPLLSLSPNDPDIDDDRWRVDRFDTDSTTQWQRARRRRLLWMGVLLLITTVAAGAVSLLLSPDAQDTQRQIHARWQAVQQLWQPLQATLSSSVADASSPDEDATGSPLQLQLIEPLRAQRAASDEATLSALNSPDSPSTAAATLEASRSGPPTGTTTAPAPSAEPDTARQIEIILSDIPTPLDAVRLSNAAYHAFTQGEFRKAEQYYQQVMNLVGETREPLMGLAATELSMGRVESAKQRYQTVLMRWPDDAAAQQALRYIEQQSATQQQLSQRHQRALAFAKAQRWPDAVRAYQLALSEDNNNPNLAFNLAVAYEHAGRAEQALIYYQYALTWSQRRQASFDRAVATRRIEKLSG